MSMTDVRPERPSDRPPEHRPTFALLTDGGIVEIRLATPADLDEVRRLHEEMSDDNKRMRFFGAGKRAGEESARRICDQPRPGYAGLVAVLNFGIVGVAEYTYAEEPGQAEVAFVVEESYHGRGVGTLLLEHLAVTALRNGLREFVAYVLSDNYDMQRVFADAGLSVTTRVDHGSSRLVVDLTEDERHLQAVTSRERIAEVESLRPLLQPRSVVVVGAGRRPGSVGRAILDNVRKFGFAGPIYAVNASVPPDETIGGVPAFRSVLELPTVPDLAVIAVPAAHVAEVARQCAGRGVRAAVAITSGLHPAAGKTLLTTCRRHGMRLVGPTSLGIAVAQAPILLNATFARYNPLSGQAGVIVQSGGVGIALLEHLSRLGVGVTSFVSVGDKYDVSGNDMLQWWAADKKTELAILYLESFGNPRKFGRLARELAHHIPVLTVAAGRSEAAQRAAASHTAAATSPSAAREALFVQSGIIAARSLEELAGTAALLAHQPLPAGPSVAIVSSADGAGVLAAHACTEAGLILATLPTHLQQVLQRILPAAASVTNPVETTAAVTADSLRSTIEEVAANPAVDAVLALIAPTALGNLLPALTHKPDTNGKPLLAVNLAQPEAVAALRCGAAGFVPCYAEADPATRALSHARHYAQWRERPAGQPLRPEGVDAESARKIVDEFLTEHPDGGWLDPQQCTRLLDAYQIPLVTQRLATTVDAAVTVADDVGGPVAVKAYWPGLVRKTEVGGVQLGAIGEAAVRSAYRQLAERSEGALQGVLIQPMAAPGAELLVGISQDEVFGPLVVLGLGGTDADVLDEQVARLAPLTRGDIDEMLATGKIARLLGEHRGRLAADTTAVGDLLARVAQLASDIPQLVEAVFDPTIARSDGVTIVDARIRLLPRETPAPSLRRLK
jgi:acyl-CoA synthetase (NDP forming)/RimJ/RimL family protein N-acetyltransferase